MGSILIESDTPTFRRQDVPMALVIGGSETLLRSVAKAALTAQVFLAECTVNDALNTAAEMKPLVLILPEDVYSADSLAYEELARDVQAGLLRVNQDNIDLVYIENELIALMMTAESVRDL